MRTLKAQGIVIKRRNINEADRIVTLLTRDLGKIAVKATGVRRITSRRSSHVELLNLSEVSLYFGRSLPVLLEAQTQNNFTAVKESLQKTGIAYHMCEIVDSLCPDAQEQNLVFSLMKETLESLSESQNPLPLIHTFEVKLLLALGFWHKRPEDSEEFDTHHFIESILERKLKSHKIFSHFSV